MKIQTAIFRMILSLPFPSACRRGPCKDHEAHSLMAVCPFFPLRDFVRFAPTSLSKKEGLRLCHSLLLAAGALAKIMKLTALWLFVLFCTSPLQEQAPDGLARKKPSASR